MTHMSQLMFQENKLGDMFLKVSIFQKQIFLFSIEPKNERNYFLNSALASKMSQIKQMKALILISGYGI